MTVNPIKSSNVDHQEAVKEFSRILTAAVISSHFRQMLLSDPGKAISAGFGGEVFHLETDDKKQVASIQVETLADFAAELNRMRYLWPPSLGRTD